ncbi:MAG: Gfo/Idh/MocA family oxidoreductase [Chloroflexota bacterium]
MPAPLTAAMLGAGDRGFFAYGPFAKHHPQQLKFVAVAEPNPIRRRRFARAHDIPPDRQFTSWEELLLKDQLADVLLNMTPISMHVPSTVCALEIGYPVLLEQPMASTLADMQKLEQVSRATGQLLQICNPLRHTAFFNTLHDVLESGQIGDVITVEHRDNISYWHMAHSFVRGERANSKEFAPIIVSRCANDLDLLRWNMGGSPQHLNSTGALIHFKAENAPSDSTLRCTADCAVENCLYDARRIYLNLSNSGWPISDITEDMSVLGRQNAIETGRYGQCVYHCSNDVVDQQIVNMQFKQGTSVVLVMHGHANRDERTMRYDGTKATLRGRFGPRGGNLEIQGHWANRWESVDIPVTPNAANEGYFGQLQNFLLAVNGEVTPSTTISEMIESHYLAFAAEAARHQQTGIDIATFKQTQQI